MTTDVAGYRTNDTAGAGMLQCTSCKAVITRSESLFDDEGRIVCPACNLRGDIATSERNVMLHVRNAGYSSIGMTLCQFFFNPFGLVSILTIIAGAGAIVSVLRSPTVAKQLGAHRIPVLVASSLAVLMSSCILLLVFGVIGFALFG